MYDLGECSVSAATQYKICAQMLMSSVHKNPIWYAFHNTTESSTI